MSNDYLIKYKQQKIQAAVRGIAWNLTFEEWLNWWGDDIANRGVKGFELQMQRLHDKGAYELGNIIKGNPKQNAITRGNGIRLKNNNELANKHQENLDAMIYEPSLEPLDYEEDEVIDYDKEMRSNGYIEFSNYRADK